MLSRTLRHLGELERSEALAHQHLALVTKAEGTESADYAMGLRNLAKLHLLKKRWAEAEKLLKRSIRIGITTLGPRDVLVADDLDLLCDSLMGQNKVVEAEKIRRQIDELERGHAGASHSTRRR